uniref:Uncharacterized protein n=1 Tax=viral metagenome TaxID=1070528 RepID=A0A6C0DL64_9ZZZZ
MKLLNITFHKGCELEIEYVFTKLAHTIDVMRFDDCETTDDNIYNINHNRSQNTVTLWNNIINNYNINK